MLIIPTGYADVIVGFDGPSGERMATTFGVQAIPSGYADVQTIVEAWLTGSSGNHWQAFASSQYTARQIDIIGPVVASTRALSLPGLAANEPLPPMVSAKVLKATGLRGRSNRGAMFLPGVAFESQQSGSGFVAPAVQTSWTGLAEALRTALDTGGHQMVILHSSASPVGTPTIVTALAASAKLATQRRRMP